MTNSEFWREIARKCELGLELDDGQFDLVENRRDRSCLGTAVTSEVRAYSLLLVGMDKEARFYLENIREHAIAAFEADETYVYRPISGENLFGKYMSLRIAGLADWALQGGAHTQLIREASFFLRQAIDRQYSGEFKKAEAVEVASLSALFSQLSDWGAVLDVWAQWSEGKKRGKSIWISAMKALVENARQLSVNDRRIEPDSSSLVRLLSRITDQKKHGAVYDRRLTMNDVVTMARIQGESVFRISDPWEIIRTIRFRADATKNGARTVPGGSVPGVRQAKPGEGG